MSEYTPNYLLVGVAGSTAHGLARKGRDEDLHGVFSWPTRAFWGLDKPAESITGHEPQDFSYHEVEKFTRLALSNNPTILELLYLEQYTDLEPEWATLVLQNRHKFLHSEGVRNSYLGYAESQFRKMIQRGGTFSSDTKNRTAKHARHLFRLMEQGEQLLSTGTFSVKVTDPQWYFDLEGMTAGQWVDLYFKRAVDLEKVESVLPDEPDREHWNKFLIDYREAH